MRTHLAARIHISWLIGVGCLAVVIGAGLCVITRPGLFDDMFWVILAAGLLIFSFVHRRVWVIVVVVFAGLSIGLYRGSVLSKSLLEYQVYSEQTAVVKGLVSQDASIGPKGDQRLTLRSVTINDQKLAGEIWISVTKHDIKRGDSITVKGKLSGGFGNMAATIYRAEVLQIERPKPGDVARRVRDWFSEGVKRAIPEPQVNLGLGYLLGQKTALPPDLEEDIRTVGLTHAVVASGYNLTILVIFCRRLFLRVSKYTATFTSSILVVSFMLITGLSPSMTRAGLVACLGLLVWYYGRKMHPFVLLSFAACITVIINPSYVWGDLGWYLSFGSFIGVIVLAPLIQHYFWGLSKNVPMMRQLIVDTLSAQILTWPLILLSFGQFTLYSLPANMLVLPFVPFAMLTTFLAGIFGLLLPDFAQYAGLPATIVLRYSTEVISRFARLPHSETDVSFNVALMVGSYICIAIAITYFIRRTRHDFRSDNQPESI